MDVGARFHVVAVPPELTVRVLKVRFLGLTKNLTHLLTLFAMSNLCRGWSGFQNNRFRPRGQ